VLVNNAALGPRPWALPPYLSIRGGKYRQSEWWGKKGLHVRIKISSTSLSVERNRRGTYFATRFFSGGYAKGEETKALTKGKKVGLSTE